MSLGERIKTARDNKGLKQSELADLIDVRSSGVISNWEKDINKPDADKIIKLCEVLDISVSYLLDYYGGDIDITFEEKEKIKKYRRLDNYGKDVVDTVLNKELARTIEQMEYSANVIELKFLDAPVSAGLGDMLEDYENSEKVFVPLNSESRRADFILKIYGDSMEPKFSDGDYVLVRQQPTVDKGQIGIFGYDGKGYVKKFGGDRLISLNKKYSDIYIDESARCFGLVLGTTSIIDG